ncbi:MAG: transcriptional regulator [Nonomuraea sp.]|nr:transcriptional regulator [Nonomuraea sp.]
MVSVLGEESRHAMFDFVRRAGRPVTRDEAAASVGISRKLAAFHLDKLVAAGLLRAGYAAPAGVGRRPKVYLPGETEIQVSIPERRHAFLAELFLDAVLTQGDGESGAQAAIRTARERGTDLGAAERDRSRPGRLGAERALTYCQRMLERHGFEPVREGPAAIRLRNCPFHPLTARAPELVCGMNQGFLSGYLDGLQAGGVEAVLDPQPGECCVRLRS